MVASRYIPNHGDMIWVNFNPTHGHEQRGKRPALVISPKEYNAKAGLALVCPITSQVKGYPFEVPLDVNNRHCAVLVDQIRSIDWNARKASFLESVHYTTFREVKEKLFLLLE